MFLAGCGTPMNPSFNRLTTSYAEALSSYQVDSILSNIIRTTEDRPLNFLDIPSINGSGTVSHSHSASFSLGGLSVNNFYGAITSASVSPSISLGTGFNFTQSSLDNATFWAGFSTPVSLKNVHNYRHSYLPREVLFILVIDSIELRKNNSERLLYLHNQATNPNYDQFTKVFYDLLEAGLDIKPFPSAPASEIKKSDTALNAKDQSRLAVTKGSKNSQTTPVPNSQLGGSAKSGEAQYGGGNPNQTGSAFGNPSSTPNFKWCLNRELAVHGARERFNPSLYCETEIDMKVDGDSPTFHITLRSPKHIFSFSGDVVKAQNEKDSPRLLIMKPLLDTRYKKSHGNNDYALIVVQKNPPPTLETYSIASGSYGDSYAIPRENNGYTPLVVDFLSQLIIFNKVSGSIPQQPAVLLK
jgi:hypothetical protein